MQGVPDITSGIFTHSGSGQHGGMFAPVHQGVGAGAPPAGPQGDKPTAAQAAAGRLQRASARQASKAAQQQKRQAQARAAAKGGNTGAPVGNAAKRKLKEEEELADEDDEDGARLLPSPSPHRPDHMLTSYPTHTALPFLSPTRTL